MATTGRRPGPRRVTRPSAGQAAALVAVVWFVSMGFALAVAADTTIGPVIFSFTRDHGVHLGDVYAFVVAGVVALLGTVWIVTDHIGRRRRWERSRRRAAQREREAADQTQDDMYAYEYDEQDGAEPIDEPDPDLVETVFLERDPGPVAGRRSPRSAAP